MGYRRAFLPYRVWKVLPHQVREDFWNDLTRDRAPGAWRVLFCVSSTAIVGVINDYYREGWMLYLVDAAFPAASWDEASEEVWDMAEGEGTHGWEP
jgi:hypothetical protein